MGSNEKFPPAGTLDIVNFRKSGDTGDERTNDINYSAFQSVKINCFLMIIFSLEKISILEMKKLHPDPHHLYQL